MGRGIAIGESDLKSIIDDECLYIDKTEFIKNIIDSKSRVTLITRPRRFGKTLNMSTLKYFFSVQEKENRYLFKNLKIEKAGEKYKKEQNKYPVIWLTLKGMSSGTYKEMIGSFKYAMYYAYLEHINLLESEKVYEFEKKTINDILYRREEEDTLKESIRALAQMLNRHYGQKVILLLDEYDVPIQNAYIYGYYEEAIKFFKTFYGTTFKDNKNFEKIVITGVSRVSKIMEFKVYRKSDESKIEETIENAKRQIEEKGYEAELRQRGCTNITKIVYAFKGKEVKMEVY